MTQIESSPAVPQSETSFSPDQAPSIGFEDLALPLLDSLYNFARWLTRDPHDAEDIVQESYLKALRSFASFAPGTNFRAWMFRILKNTFLSSSSKLDRRMTVAMTADHDAPDLAVSHETPETILIDSSTRRSVESAINNLAPDHRKILLLCEVEEMSYREIAEVLSIPMGTVMSRLARARRAVRDSMARNTAVPDSR